MNRLTLRFVVADEERDFWASEPIAGNYRFTMVHFTMGCLLLFAYSLVCDGVLKGKASAPGGGFDQPEAYTRRLVPTGVAAGLTLLQLVFAAGARWQPLPEWVLAAFYAAAGGAWAAANTIGNSVMPLQSSSAGVLVYLIAGHMLATYLSLFFVTAGSCAVAATYIVLLAIER